MQHATSHRIAIESINVEDRLTTIDLLQTNTIPLSSASEPVSRKLEWMWIVPVSTEQASVNFQLGSLSIKAKMVPATLDMMFVKFQLSF